VRLLQCRQVGNEGGILRYVALKLYPCNCSKIDV